MSDLNTIEDRLLVLKNQVDTLVVKAGYKPDQERDERGRWEDGGGGSGVLLGAKAELAGSGETTLYHGQVSSDGKYVYDGPKGQWELVSDSSRFKEIVAELRAKHWDDIVLIYGEGEKAEAVLRAYAQGQLKFKDQVDSLAPRLNHLTAADQVKAKSAIRNYIGSSSDINGFLRDNEGRVTFHREHVLPRHDMDPMRGPYREKRNAQKGVLALDRVFEVSPRTTKPLTVYRGIGLDVNTTDLPPGTKFQDHGYQSTTLDPAVADTFAARHSSALLEIRVPTGTRVMGIGGLNEAEVLLPRGSRFQVVDTPRYIVSGDLGIEVIPVRLVLPMEKSYAAEE